MSLGYNTCIEAAMHTLPHPSGVVSVVGAADRL